MLKCDLCGTTFSRRGILRQLLANKHGCTNASYSYTTASSSNTINFMCDLCAKTFTQRGTLQRHMNSMHTGNSFLCKQCEKVFTRRDNLMRHTRRMHYHFCIM